MSPKPTKPRAVLYLRQSVSREESISLELQETAGRAHAEQHGYEVVAVESDPGISGRTWNRPAVQRVMAAIESGEADVIVLWKWSRLSRSRLDWAVAADKVETAGGRIESATEPIDVSTSTGRLARGMLTEFAAFESERIGDTWKESQARRIKQGLPGNGRPRFGYTYDRETGFTPDPAAGPILAETYRRYISGESFHSLSHWLNETGIQGASSYTKHTGPWVATTIRRILDNGFGAGYIRHHGKHLPGAHQAVITEAEWNEYLTRRKLRAQTTSAERTQYLYTGLLYCQQCDKRMYGHTKKSGYIVYRCNATLRLRTHPGGSVSADRVEAATLDWLKTLAKEINDAAATNTPAPSAPLSRQLPALRRNLLKTSSRLDNLTLKLIDETIPQDTYERLRDNLIGERKSLEARIHELELADVKPVALLAPDLLANWDRLPFAAKRDLLGRVVGRVLVTHSVPLNMIEVRGRWEV